MPRAIVISFGDEMTSGQRVDTNSAWLSARLLAIGHPVVMHLTAGDDMHASVEAIRFAALHADIVVMTGGLGPTVDDVTRAALAAATGHELELDATALAHIERIFARRGREMPQRNRDQAMFPRDAVEIDNPHGTAPGIDLTASALGKTTRFIALPGVSAEAKEMWSMSVEPSLVQANPMSQIICQQTLKCFGDGESAIEQRLGELMGRDRNPLVGITVQQATITLRLTAVGTSTEQCNALIDATISDVRARLRDLVFGEGDVELQDVIVSTLDERDLTLATIECDAQGLLVHWMQAAALRTAPDVFRGGLVCRDPVALNALIDVEPSDAMQPDTEAFCRRAAESIRRQCRVSHVLAIGAIPEPDDAASTVFVGIAKENETLVAKIPYGGHPDVRGPRLVKGALNELRKSLLRDV